jgi:predicted nucleotidyltransferase
MLISSRFSKLLEKIEPNSRDQAIYALHERTVTTRLETIFKTNSVRRMGSYARETSIRTASDIDLMLIFKREEIRWGDDWKTSDTILDNVRDELRARYRNTRVVRDEQAIVVRFRGNQYPIDVVPAFYWSNEAVTWQNGETNQYPVYMIPDANGWWMPTSPDAHNKYLNDADSISRGKLKSIAKLIKFWRSCRTPSIPLNSFYVEIWLAVNEICVGVKSYAQCFIDALISMARDDCSGIEDPLGISGNIPSVNTERKRVIALNAVKASVEHAERAILAENSKNLREAVRQRNIVFNYQFPTIV